MVLLVRCVIIHGKVSTTLVLIERATCAKALFLSIYLLRLSTVVVNANVVFSSSIITSFKRALHSISLHCYF